MNDCNDQHRAQPSRLRGGARRLGLVLLVWGCAANANPPKHKVTRDASPTGLATDAGSDAGAPDPLRDAASDAQDAAPFDAGTDAASTVTRCAPGPSVGDFPCDVGAVIKARCQPCHQVPQRNGAHFPLLSYEDTQQPFGSSGALRFNRMAQVIEPAFLPHMPPNGAAQPTASELETLRSWLRACAPPVTEGAGCDTPQK